MARTNARHSHQQQQPRCTAKSTPAPSFLVYPLPSIADESFLQLIFCSTVKRSLFLGFGRGRFAVVELASEAVAAEVEAVIRMSAAPSTAGQQEGNAAPHDANGAAADVAAKHGALESFADDDAFERVTLADLFAPPPRSDLQASASAQRQERDNNKGGAAVNGGSHDFSHIPHLVWRGRPVHVVVSGVRVADFYGSGGVVPEHRVKRSPNAKEKLNTGKRPRSEADSAAALSPVASQQTIAKERPQNSRTRDATTATAAPTRKSPFPKNCCQKCGSADHFTRHCDGSGTSVSVAAAASPPVVARVDKHKQQQGVPSATAAAPIATPVQVSGKAKPVLQRTSKDQCKHCGSEAHLSRHCPVKH
ncbi:hypothetical protein GH5_08519 [Leishmania sp. Ghana 2012 LV757]|uniref:hypothetical protein n=1 Tax=Leishmania sp. Ghana 2012 LV757 TaxID=2803181 RepID=UPI001B4CC423|nr:hypothetical protein GH5_08519 [Leishmania sp. Ghana 2012 LV757]